MTPVFWQCEKLPPALPLRCHRNFVHSVSKETMRTPTGTLVFLPRQYAVGHSLNKTSCCVIQAAQHRTQGTVFYRQHSGDQDNMKYSISHLEIQSGKHTTPELCTYIKQR